jgi:hypothetical protein
MRALRFLIVALLALGCRKSGPVESLPQKLPIFTFHKMRIGDEITPEFKKRYRLSPVGIARGRTKDKDIVWKAAFFEGKLTSVTIQFPESKRESVVDMYTRKFGGAPERDGDSLRWSTADGIFVITSGLKGFGRAEIIPIRRSAEAEGTNADAVLEIDGEP